MSESGEVAGRTHLRPVSDDVLAASDGEGPKLLGRVLPLRTSSSVLAIFAADAPSSGVGESIRITKLRRERDPSETLLRSSDDRPETT